MKVAIVHDWFNEIGGAEKVVKELLVCYPDADLYCLFDFFNDQKRSKYLSNKQTKRTFIQYIPFAKKFYRFLFPFFPKAIEQLDLSGYDLIISSSYCVAKGVKKDKNQLHICYCHSPVRYAWDLKQDYLNEVKESLTRKLFSFLLERLKNWDKESTYRVDHFIANSQNVASRIQQNYNRTATVIYPPVDIDKFEPEHHKSNYYITVSRLVSYKKTELLIKAFKELPHLKLLVAGAGPTKERLKRMAPENVELLGYIESNKLTQLIKGAKAFVAAANEDFGITIVEAQACGTPVIVPYLGGYKESVTNRTGLFFKDQTVESIKNALKEFETGRIIFDPQAFSENIQQFRKERFQEEVKRFIETKYKEFKNA